MDFETLKKEAQRGRRVHRLLEMLRALGQHQNPTLIQNGGSIPRGARAINVWCVSDVCVCVCAVHPHFTHLQKGA